MDDIGLRLAERGQGVAALGLLQWALAEHPEVDMVLSFVESIRRPESFRAVADLGGKAGMVFVYDTDDEGQRIVDHDDFLVVRGSIWKGAVCMKVQPRVGVGERFGKSGMWGLVYPSHWSMGVLVTGAQNGALEWPWSGATRTGAYLGWGSIKVGYAGGRSGKLLLTRQTQVVPFVF